MQGVGHRSEAVRVSRIDICPGPYEEGYMLQGAEFKPLVQHRAPQRPLTRDVYTCIAAHSEEQILQQVDACGHMNQPASKPCSRWPPSSLIQKADDKKPVIHNSNMNHFVLELYWNKSRASFE
jgi:hypothetical protein